MLERETEEGRKEKRFGFVFVARGGVKKRREKEIGEWACLVLHCVIYHKEGKGKGEEEER